ncbi:MAG: hypothetical protein KGS72_20250 [Cyanobacteria bacterium REEB67]|nr:hypothetical protein [Cyanobacteria bacterium REEB67]
MNNVNDGQEVGRPQAEIALKSEDNPHWILLRRLRRVLEDTSVGLLQMRWTQQQFVLVDNAPRHDTALDQATMNAIHSLTRSNRGDAKHRGLRELTHSLTVLEPLLANIRGIFRGEEKIQIEDRLERHVHEARRLAESFHNLPTMEGHPNQPYAIRQHCMADIVLSVTDLTSKLKLLRRELKELGLPEAEQAILFEQEARLYRLNALFKKWRDNPSQKLAGKLLNCADNFEQIRIALEKLRSASRQECLRQGIHFMGRCGEIISE